MAEQLCSLKEIKSYLEYILNGNYLRTLGISLSGNIKHSKNKLKLFYIIIYFCQVEYNYQVKQT